MSDGVVGMHERRLQQRIDEEEQERLSVSQFEKEYEEGKKTQTPTLSRLEAEFGVQHHDPRSRISLVSGQQPGEISSRAANDLI